MPLIELNNITKQFERKIALSSLSFHVKKGEMVALIGPSGAGKSTLLNTLAGITAPNTGTYLLDGVPIQHYKKRKELAKKIGVIRQQFDLIASLPVIQNVLAGRLGEWGFFKSMLSLFLPQDKQLAANALNRVGLLDKLYDQTSKLSGGEQQRVALARLLVQSPAVILADEPVASLDPARAEDVLAMLTKLVKEEGQTLVMSLHSVEYAKKYFSRIIALRDGEVFFDLPTSEITKEHLAELYLLKEMAL
ncbi:phosphonate ABC transporter ATP-binding protein [Peribacillus cavernae]|uniref:Phosphonate ABC transporter ATP-binding protein n=1 Tax=Peribacillus cavernae TaxID=1674310 RepID=A0A3S0TXV8_9BACI|nr:phosphonate ABC transporter ATP-binding protein [Peribacillus cavernae]MDQ0219888.1 phosphonate transport system ATP-binding protein [Peribacillus cavernae]RUQ26629.1 phosphonate ABC transporter ATP-binding protein [Peribacillus cavernae]